MTQRINARRFYWTARETHAAPLRVPPGDDVVRVLEWHGQLIADLATHPEFRCIACDTLIEPGETAWTSRRSTLPYPTICYSCGIGWEMHQGRITFRQAARIPAYGGLGY